MTPFCGSLMALSQDKARGASRFGLVSPYAGAARSAAHAERTGDAPARPIPEQVEQGDKREDED